MVSSNNSSVSAYLDSLPEDRRAAMRAVVATVRKHLPRGYEEGMVYGMMGWYIPLSRYPDTYNKQPLCIASLASQKQYMSLYLNGVYGDIPTQTWFEDEFRKSGKKLDMGKSCVRFKKLDDLPLDVIGKVIARMPPDALIDVYEATRASTKDGGKARAAAKPVAKAKAKAKAKPKPKPKAAATAKATKPTAGKARSRI